MSAFFNHLKKDRINYWQIDFGLPTEKEILFPGTVILLSHLKKVSIQLECLSYKHSLSF